MCLLSRFVKIEQESPQPLKILTASENNSSTCHLSITISYVRMTVDIKSDPRLHKALHVLSDFFPHIKRSRFICETAESHGGSYFWTLITVLQTRKTSSEGA